MDTIKIDSSLFERVLLADNNLSDVVKNLSQSTEKTFRDGYVLEFLDIPIKHSEKTLQQALVSSLKDFILELGRGFTFMGQEYRLQVDVEDRLILIGQSKAFKTLVVVHVERRETIRIISARKATKHEQKFYEEY